jgi:N4-gp56 family major capsid protein
MAHANASVLSDAVKTLYEKRLLSRALPRLVHGKHITHARLNQYGSYELRKYAGLSAVTTTLTEGNVPNEQASPTVSTTTLTPLWYGAWLGFTDKIVMTAYDPLLSEFSSILGEQAGLSVDTLIRDVLVAGATADYAGGATSTATVDSTNDKIAFSDFLAQVANLDNQNAMPIEGNSYWVVAHPFTWLTLMQDSMFATLVTREGGEAYRRGEMGSLLRCRIYVTSNAYKNASAGTGSIDVYSTLFMGAEAVGAAGIAALTPNVSLDAGGGELAVQTGRPQTKPVDLIINDLGETGFDPLRQKGTIGWKLSHKAAVLNANWIRELEHAVSS